MTSLYSPRWYRVAGLSPRLSAQVRVRRQRVRGESWVLLADPIGGRSVRLNSAAYAVAGRLDGRLSMQALWDWQLAHSADPATQDELIDLLAQLREASLVQFDRPADFDTLLPHLERVSRPKGRGNLLAWRVPLANPTALLDRLRRLQRPLFSRAALVVWAIAVGLLLVLALQHAPTLWAHGRQWLATPRFALLAAVLYVPIKLLHELAHGLAVRRWGGAVREAGVTLMLLLPVPYVDASAATGFVQRRHRIAVGAAGIMAELALAAVALPLWLWLGPEGGLLRDAAFVTLVITGVSTLLFNANPLQRLDGYYILTDAFDLPNLGPRSRSWWRDALVRRLLRVPGAEPMPVARGEVRWLAGYAPLAWLYGIAIAFIAVAWLGQISLVLGILCGALLGWQMLLRPAVQLVAHLRRSALAQVGTARRWRRLALGGGAVLALALLLPLPQRTLVQGVVWPSDQAQLRADEDGFVEAVQVQDGQTVQAGAAVLQLANPKLRSSLERQRARVAALETELVQALPGDGAAAGDARAELAAASAELARLEERTALLVVRAGVGGRVALPQAADLPGQFVRRGRLLGQVLGQVLGSGSAAVRVAVRVAVPESEAGSLRGAQGPVSVRLAGSRDTAHRATLVRDGGGAVLQLPSAALSVRHGGNVQTDPQDAGDLKPLQPVVLLDVLLDVQIEPPQAAGLGRGRIGERVAERTGELIGEHPSERASERIGERAWVRFDAGAAPLSWQLAQTLQREMLRRFNPQF